MQTKKAVHATAFYSPFKIRNLSDFLLALFETSTTGRTTVEIRFSGKGFSILDRLLAITMHTQGNGMLRFWGMRAIGRMHLMISISICVLIIKIIRQHELLLHRV